MASINMKKEKKNEILPGTFASQEIVINVNLKLVIMLDLHAEEKFKDSKGIILKLFRSPLQSLDQTNLVSVIKVIYFYVTIGGLPKIYQRGNENPSIEEVHTTQ